MNEKLVLEEYAKKFGYSLEVPDSRVLYGNVKINVKVVNSKSPLNSLYNMYPSNVSISSNPNCCGTKLMFSLIIRNKDPEERRREAWILVKAVILATKGNGLLNYVCIGKQKEIIDALKGNGFKLVAKSKNPKTRNILYLYAYEF